MRALPRASTIGSMLIHPQIHLAIARQRHQDLLADAERRRLAKAWDHGTGRRSAHRAPETEESRHPVMGGACVRGVRTAADHFGHREAGGIVVDLFWNRSQLKDEFRVEVEDERDGTRFVLHLTTGQAALQAFYHPFSMVED